MDSWHFQKYVFWPNIKYSSPIPILQQTASTYPTPPLLISTSTVGTHGANGVVSVVVIIAMGYSYWGAVDQVANVSYGNGLFVVSIAVVRHPLRYRFPRFILVRRATHLPLKRVEAAATAAGLNGIWGVLAAEGQGLVLRIGIRLLGVVIEAAPWICICSCQVILLAF